MRYVALVGLLVSVTLTGCGSGAPSGDGAGPSTDAKAAKTKAVAPTMTLVQAIAEGNVEVVRQHVVAGTDPNSKTPDGAPVLNYAALLGHKEIVEKLLAAGADVNGADVQGNTPMHAAAFLGRADVATLLIDKGAKIDARNQLGGAAIDSANVDWPTTQGLATALGVPTDRAQIEAGRKQVVALLEKSGAKAATGGALIALVRAQDVAGVKKALSDKEDPNDQDPRLGIGALSWAAAIGNTEIVTALLDAGADVNGKNRDGGSALHVAAFLGRASVVKVLLDRKADPNLKNMRGESPFDGTQSDAGVIQLIGGLLQLEVNVSKVQKGREAVVALLKEAGAKVGTGGSLLAAIRKQDVAGVKKALAVEDVEVNATEAQTGVTALGWAALLGNLEIATLLVDAEADVNVRNRDGATPLHCAMFMGRSEIVALLLDRGADPEAKNERGELPETSAIVDEGATRFVTGLLQLKYDVAAVAAGRKKSLDLLENGTGTKELVAAVRAQDVAAVKGLLAKKTNPNGRDADLGINVLSWAAYHGSVEIAGQLIAAGADVNGKSQDGSRPLHAAAFVGQDGVVALLLAKGADAKAVNEDDESAADVARSDVAATKVAAGLLQLKLDFKLVEAGRKKCVALLTKSP